VPDVKLISTSRLGNRKANSIQVMKMADAFAELGCRVDVVLPGWRKAADSMKFGRSFGLKSFFRITFIPNFSIGSKFGIATFALSVFIRSLFWPKKAVIVTRNERVARLLAFASKKVLYENHAFAFSKANVTQKYRRRVKTLMSKKNVRMVAISGRLRDLWAQDGVDAERIHVAHDGVDLESFRRIAAYPIQELRESFGLPPDRPIVCYAGSLEKDRGIDFILEAAAFYQQRNYVFLILGGSPAEVRQYQGRAPAGHIVFAGYIENSAVPLYLRCVDLLVMPYQKNVVTIDGCSPMKTFEYLASGKPILAPRFSSYMEVLREFFSGVITYDPDNREAFITEIGNILDNPETRSPVDRLKKLEPYSWRTRAQIFLDLHARCF
jgi:glycosyltransferase involved in cell wall biosynthesis